MYYALKLKKSADCQTGSEQLHMNGSGSERLHLRDIFCEDSLMLKSGYVLPRVI